MSSWFFGGYAFYDLTLLMILKIVPLPVTIDPKKKEMWL